MMVLTESEAPTKTKASIARGKARASPKTIVANPKATTEIKKTGPWRRSPGIWEIARAANLAPTDWAAESQPYSKTPTRKISRAKIGIKVLADEKKVAKKSSTMLERMIGRGRMKWMPSMMAGQLI